MTKSLKAHSSATPSRLRTTTTRIQRLRKPMMRLSPASPPPTTEHWFAYSAQVQSQGVYRLQSAAAAGPAADHAVVAVGDGAARQVSHWLARAPGHGAEPAV